VDIVKHKIIKIGYSKTQSRKQKSRTKEQDDAKHKTKNKKVDKSKTQK